MPHDTHEALIVPFIIGLGTPFAAVPLSRGPYTITIEVALNASVDCQRSSFMPDLCVQICSLTGPDDPALTTMHLYIFMETAFLQSKADVMKKLEDYIVLRTDTMEREGTCTQSESSTVKQGSHRCKYSEHHQHSHELSEEIDGKYDVLGCHHQCNRIPQPPSQNNLKCHCQFARTPEADHMDIECLSKYKWACIHLKCGMIPHYQEELYTILHEDESIQWVCDQASQLIQSTKFLHGARDAQALQGKEQNFMHKLLYTISAAVYYGTSQKLLGQTLEFKEYLPEAAIVLIAAGCGKIHDLGTQVEPINWKVVNHWGLGPHLQQQLARWPKFASKTGIGLVAGDEDEYALAPMD
ncbi:hypothetical protein EDC04DRAFT_2608634 [Pisolithus marmoratus]|nr:hypothetical protein EDC04DRAFT_2608634 [Pisolithus marmoratus]